VQTRVSNSYNDRGTVDLFDLLKASLRQRPEYIIVGEVRGNEAQTLFQAMNSGHTTLSTLHAGNIEEALNRLTNEPINVPPAMFGALNLMVIQTFHYRGGKMIRDVTRFMRLSSVKETKSTGTPCMSMNPKKTHFGKYLKSHERCRRSSICITGLMKRCSISLIFVHHSWQNFEINTAQTRKYSYK
jgi:flagellar protein FlaI